jgi:NADH-quinone oxidoreductase subunit M
LTLIAASVLASRFWTAPPIEVGTVQPRLLWRTAEVPLAFLGTTPPTVRFQLGLDGPGIAMILLTTIVTVAVLLIVPKQIESKTTEYAASMLFTESFLLGAFLSMDLVSFYIFFELTLLPVMALMIVWGTGQSRTAAGKFVLFTLAGSLPMMAGLVGLATLASPHSADMTISIPSLASQWNPSVDSDIAMSLPANLSTQRWIFGLILLGLGIKMAILPFHTWLPTTYAAAHPTTTALLAGVILKLGLFGILRILLPILPTPAAEFSEFWGPALGAVAVVYGALIALAQTDLRLLLAYGSLGHVGFITMGLFSLTVEGLSGAAIQMFNHGITTAAMFLLVAMLMRRRPDFDWSTSPSGLTRSFPLLASLFLFFTLAGAGMPGLNNFVGEILAMSGLIQRSLFWTAIASLGIIFGAWYGLRVIERLFFGPLSEITYRPQEKRDLRRTELASLIPLAIISIAIGVFPASAIHSISRDVAPIARHHEPKRIDPTITGSATKSTLAQRGQNDH